MNRDETVALFLQGREAWNTWAEKMLAERKALEDGGQWSATESFGILIPLNYKTLVWAKAAAVDFSDCLLPVDLEGRSKEKGEEVGKQGKDREPLGSVPTETVTIDFMNFLFPSEASFKGATFDGAASFQDATFAGVTRFSRVTFTGSVFFASATFRGDSSFGKAAFGKFASFMDACFSGPTSFNAATFSDHAGFRNAIFGAQARFTNATFSSDAFFESVTFQDATNYGKAAFLKETRFRGAKIDRAFDMTGATFAQVPAFNQADFKQAPDLDDVRFPLPGFWRGGKAELVAKYRALRRMAIQGADYEREQMAYKGELRARRWTVDKWWSIGTWIGLFYDAFADCGRSIVRPANAWLRQHRPVRGVLLAAGGGGRGGALHRGRGCGGAGAVPLGEERAGDLRRHARRAGEPGLSLPL